MIPLMLPILIIIDVMSEVTANYATDGGDVSNKAMEGNVVQGSDASVNSYPHAVMLKFKFARPPICGGSLIMAQIILTAGTCTEEFDHEGGETIAYLGHNVPRYAKVVRKVVNFKLHPRYDPYGIKNNMALMFLEKPVEFSATVKKITFLDREGIGSMVGYGVGWGRQGKKPVTMVMFRELKGTKQHVLDAIDCRNKTGLRISDQTYCGFPLYGQFYKDDAGAGLVFKGEIRLILGMVLSHIIDVVAMYTLVDPTWMKKPAYEMYKESCGIKDYRRRRTKRQAETCADINITELTDL